MSFLDKVISYKIDENKIVKTIDIFGIKIKRAYYNYLFNEKICSKVGIKTLLFIRGDGIGDFIMDLPYIKHIKQSDKYKDYTIILGANSAIIELAKKYIDEYIDEYYLITYNNNNEKSLIKEYRKMSFTTLLNPVDAKTNYNLEKFAKYINAKEKICHYGYYARYNILNKDVNKSEIFNTYTKVIDTGEKLILVKDRCKLFFEKLLGKKIPYVETLQELDTNLKSEYIVISPFARDKKRIYSEQNFIKIIDFINSEFNIPVVILGSKNERTKAQNIKGSCKYSNMVYDMSGITLSESIMYIKNAKLMVANETGTVHIAQNYGIKTVCISNGSFMKAFWPYKGESYVSYIYPENIEDYLSKNNMFGYSIDYDINTVDYKKVIEKISEVLEKEKCATV